MNLFRDTVHRYGLDGALVDSAVCSPVEARHGTKALQASKVGLFEVSVLKSSSIYVNNFFQSAKNRSAAESRQVSKMKVEKGSIWDEVCKLVVALPSVEVQIARFPMVSQASDRPEKRPRLALLDKLPTIGASGQWPTAPPIAKVDIGSMVQVKSFQEKYILGDILGTGSFGVVFSTLEAHVGVRMAVKVEVRRRCISSRGR